MLIVKVLTEYEKEERKNNYHYYNMENKLDLMDYVLEWCEDMYKFDGWIFSKDY